MQSEEFMPVILSGIKIQFKGFVRIKRFNLLDTLLLLRLFLPGKFKTIFPYQPSWLSMTPGCSLADIYGLNVSKVLKSIQTHQCLILSH